MKKIFIVILILSVISCTSKKQNGLVLFNELTFKMYEGEANVEINDKTKDQYFKYFHNELIQIPLFKHIKHNNYEMFIGIPYKTSIRKIVTSQEEKQDSTKTNFNSDAQYYYNTNKKEGIYIAEYATKVDDKSLIYIATLSSSSGLRDSLFNESALSKRINSSR